MSITAIRFSGRIFAWVFILMMIATATVVSRQAPLYEAMGELEVPQVVRESRADVVEASSISCGVEVNTVVAILASKKMRERVIGRLSGEEREAFLRPYGRTDYSDEEIARILAANRTLAALRGALRIEMRYRHPDPRMAALVVDLFLQEAVAYEARVRVDETIQAFAYLERRAEQAGREAEEASAAVVAYSEDGSRLTESALGEDESYQALVKKAAIVKNVHAMILARMDELRKREEYETGWRISRAPRIPEANEYLLRPLVVTMAWGSVSAVITGVVAGILFKRRSVLHNQAEGL